MAKTRALVQRRKAIRNIRKITRTMELIATSRFMKARDRALEAAAYTAKIAELATDLSRTVTNVTHPLLQKREEVKNSLLLVITSNRGLCGGYNASILREANQRIRQVRTENTTLHLELSGRRAITYFRYQGIKAEHTYTQFEEKPRFDEVEEIANRYIESFIGGKIDRDLTAERLRARLSAELRRYVSPVTLPSVVVQHQPDAGAAPRRPPPAQLADRERLDAPARQQGRRLPRPPDDARRHRPRTPAARARHLRGALTPGVPWAILDVNQ